MKKSEELWEKIQNNTNAPREILVAYAKAIADEAKKLPQNEREARGNYADSSDKFPQTKGEEIASTLNYVLSIQDWINYESAPDLEEIGSIAGSLEIDTDDQKLWQDLFTEIDKL